MSPPTRSATDADLGAAFVDAVVAGDADRARRLFATAVDFRAVTPGRAWQADTAADVVDGIVLGTWFGPDRSPRRLLRVETDRVGDRAKVSYRMRVHGADGDSVVEQTAYFSVADGRICWMRLACSGFRAL